MTDLADQAPGAKAPAGRARNGHDDATMDVRLFRFLIVTAFVLQMGAAIAAPLANRTLPIELQAFADPLDEVRLPVPVAVVAGVSALAIIVHFVALIGLYRMLSWSRVVAIAATLLYLVAIPALGPTIQAPILTVLNDSAMLLWGMVLAVVFWSPLASDFRRAGSRAA